jgi:hypothetical protein
MLVVIWAGLHFFSLAQVQFDFLVLAIGREEMDVRGRKRLKLR